MESSGVVKVAFRVVIFIGLLAAADYAVSLRLPTPDDGLLWRDLKGLFLGLGLFLLLGYFWWSVCARSLKLSVLGWLVLAVPAAIHIFQIGQIIAKDWEGRQLATTMSIENYKEAPILWSGFDGPVGLTLSFDLVHPEGVSAFILAPEIRMGWDLDIPRDELFSAMRSGGGYFSGWLLTMLPGNQTLLKSVRDQLVYVNDSLDPKYKWNAGFDFASGTRTRLTFHLHPGTVEYLGSSKSLCLDSRSHGNRVCQTGEDPNFGCADPSRPPVTDPIYAVGGDLTALWIAVGDDNLVVDLGPVLVATLRAQSRLQGDPAAWTAMQKRLEPAGLEAAGYSPCPPGERSHSAFRTCFCRENSEPG